MSTKTANIKRTSANADPTAKNGKAPNGASAKPRKKSINERWIERYGVDDSETARKTLEMWKMIYEAHNKPKS
jgi:hypothetical protein